jgi:hypothetical protein
MKDGPQGGQMPNNLKNFLMCGACAWRRFNNPLSTFDHGAPPVFEKITLATTKAITVEDDDIAIA